MIEVYKVRLQKLGYFRMAFFVLLVGAETLSFSKHMYKCFTDDTDFLQRYY